MCHSSDEDNTPLVQLCSLLYSRARSLPSETSTQIRYKSESESTTLVMNDNGACVCCVNYEYDSCYYYEEIPDVQPLESSSICLVLLCPSSHLLSQSTLELRQSATRHRATPGSAATQSSSQAMVTLSAIDTLLPMEDWPKPFAQLPNRALAVIQHYARPTPSAGESITFITPEAFQIPDHLAIPDSTQIRRITTLEGWYYLRSRILDAYSSAGHAFTASLRTTSLALQRSRHSERQRGVKN